MHLSPQERVARGKAARRDAPRSSHGTWEPEANRLDPIALLEEQARTRVPELVPIRHGRMLISPFTFYRGAAMIMAVPTSHRPRAHASPCNSVGMPTSQTSACLARLNGR